MARTFTADLERFRDKTRDQMRRVFQQSVGDVMDAAQQAVPVDTGFLRASLASEVNGAQLAEGPDSYTLAIAATDLGDVARFAWTAEYARHVEFGTSRMSARPFVGPAAARWPQIVEANARRVR